MNTQEITSSIYADWILSNYSNPKAEIAWLFEQLPTYHKELLTDSILDDIASGTYSPPKEEE